jgi:hypothetical protein
MTTEEFGLLLLDYFKKKVPILRSEFGMSLDS